MQRNNSAVINIGIPIDLYDWNFDKRNSCFYIFEIGGGENTFEEAYRAADLLADVITSGRINKKLNKQFIFKHLKKGCGYASYFNQKQYFTFTEIFRCKSWLPPISFLH